MDSEGTQNTNDIKEPQIIKEKQTYLKSKPRYEILDGLRGVASITIILFHIFETIVIGQPSEQIINHGYLAVEFFYVLSGFVIGYAYDDRWNRMSLWDFFKRRLIRLHPMVIAGTFTGFSFYIFQQQNKNFPLIDNVELYKFILHLIMSLLMIPCPTSLDIRGWGETNAFNGPNWTLTYEYLSNILYALIFRFFNIIGLIILVIIGAALIIILSFNLDFLDLFSEGREAQKYTVIGGWSLTVDQMFIGFTRLIYPFFIGYLIYRLQFKIKIKFGFIICSFILICVLCCPRIGGISIFNSFYESIAIIIIFPLIVMMGAGSIIENEKIKILNKFLGEISYPIYITHYPLIYLQIAWFYNNENKIKIFHKVISTIAIVIYSIIASYGWLKVYDEPVRKWLTGKFLYKKIEKKKNENVKINENKNEEKEDKSESDKLKENLNKNDVPGEELGIKDD